MPVAASLADSSESASPFVGRERELDVLRAGLGDVVAGKGRLFLLVGEPGIGKTRLATEVAREAAQQGAMVLWGRCDEDVGAPPFWPWAQVLRRLFELSPRAKPKGTVLGQIVPELRTADSTAASATQATEQRFELFDCVERLLRKQARTQPLVLIFDDLHAADLPSLLLLQFFARQVHEARILVLASYRAADLERVAERAALLGPISRQGTRLTLTALNEAHVASLAARALGCDHADPVLPSIFRLTEGNPLFVGEVVQLLLAEREAHATSGTWQISPSQVEAMRLPHGVGAVIRERVQPLSESCQQLLRRAAVLGRRFSVAHLRSIASAPVEAIQQDLAEAERSGLIAAVGPQRQHFQFTHALVRRSLYEDSDPVERAFWHQQAGEALAAAHPGRGPHVAEIAHHYVQAAQFGDAGKAVDYLERAGQQALQQWAYEDADDDFEHALRILDDSPTASSRRCQLLIAQGEARYAAGRATARASFAAAAELARQLSAGEAAAPDASGPVLFARAALGVAGQGLGVLQLDPDPLAVSLLEEALQRLAPDRADLRSRIGARLAAHLSFPDTQARSLALIEEAEATARATGDSGVLAMVLGQRHLVLWRFNRIPDRLALASELVELAERLGDRTLAWEARAWRLVDRATVGDGPGVDADLRVVSALAEASRQPRLRWMATNFRVARALWRGQWEEAHALALTSLQLANELNDQLAQVAAPFQLYLIDRERGVEPDENKIRWIVQQHPESVMMRAVLITTLLDLGRPAEARAELDNLAVGDFAVVARERRLGALALLAEACWRLQDREHAPSLMRMLRPYAEYNVMYSTNVCFGATTRFLGELASVGGDWRTSAGWFADAIERNQRMGAFSQVAWTQHDAASLWLRVARLVDGPPEAADRARALVEQSSALASRLGMTRLLASLDQLRSELTAPTESQVDRASGWPGGAAMLPGTFQRSGEFWSIGVGPDLVRIQDTKGLKYMAALLRQPGVDVYALDLVDGVVDGSGTPRTSRSGERMRNRDTEPLLDAATRAAYRQRLADLREEIAEATNHNDVGRQQRLRIEEEQIQQELARAVGLHGRNRPSGSPIERARLNVTRAIKTALRKITEANANLGHLFSTSIRTGSLCSYTPDPRLTIQWNLGGEGTAKPSTDVVR